MMDRKKLEAAVDWFKTGLKMGGGWRPDFDEAAKDVLAAAEAHLATLPKPMWTVRIYREVGNAAHETYQWETQQEALLDASGHLARGAGIVEIESP